MTTNTIRAGAWFIGIAMLAAVSNAFAHTTVRSQATESTTEDNALKIGHGCSTAAGDKRPVIAQSVVFPTVTPILTASDTTCNWAAARGT